MVALLIIFSIVDMFWYYDTIQYTACNFTLHEQRNMTRVVNMSKYDYDYIALGDLKLKQLNLKYYKYVFQLLSNHIFITTSEELV